MTQKAITRSLITPGLVVVLVGLATAVALPLHAAPLPQPADLQATSQETPEPTIEATSVVTTTSAPTPTPTGRPTPAAAGTPTTAPSSIATPFPTSTPTSTQAPSPLVTPTGPPSPILTPTEPPTPTPAPTRTPTNTPAPAMTFTPAPTPTAAPTLLPLEKAITCARNNPLLIAAICLIPLLTLGLLLILAALWKARPRPSPTSVPPSPTTTGPYVESVGIPGSPRRLHLKPDGVTIGQAPENDLVITQDFPHWETVSRRHARIYAQAGRWIVEDLGSLNGVYVNGRRTGRNLLRDGWRLDIGGVEFVFQANTGEEP